MKKILSAILAVSLLASSCSKEAKLNRRLDGIWHVVLRNHKGLGVDKNEIIFFGKEKNDKGKYTWTYADSTKIWEEAGTYELKKDKLITLTSKGVVTPFTVVYYSKADLTLTNDAGDIIEAKSREYLYKKQ